MWATIAYGRVNNKINAREHVIDLPKSVADWGNSIRWRQQGCSGWGIYKDELNAPHTPRGRDLVW